MATEQQKAMLPGMTGGQNDGGVSEYEREQLKIKQEMAARAAAQAAGPVSGTAVNQPPSTVAPPVQQPPAPRPPAPELEAYWVDVYGAVWSKLPAPRVILTVNNYCTVKQLDAIVRLLIDNPELATKG
jgi:hypothetical protein